MSTDLVVVDRSGQPLVADATEKPIIITPDQTSLIKTTIAAEATDAELDLFFYDCRRRNVHPLDRLIHFTKRKGKYTPVTSIDFFRSRAAVTREHMGTDDIVYTGTPGDQDFAAIATVYRMVQGEKCPFTATARLAEYMPEPPNDFMWQKMPHGQLGKCAEALALRKGFPQELSGLYTIDEMARSDEQQPPRVVNKTVHRASEQRASAPASGARANLVTPPGRITTVRGAGKDKTKPSFWVVVLEGSSQEYTIKDQKQALDLERFKDIDHLVVLTYDINEFGGKLYHNIKSFAVDDSSQAPAEPPQPPAASPMSAGDIPFGR